MSLPNRRDRRRREWLSWHSTENPITHMEQSKHTPNDNSRPSVRAATEPFLIYCRAEKHYAAETLDKFKECFNSWLLAHLGDIAVSDLKPIHVLSFRQAMTSRNLSISRQYSLLMTLKLFLKFCRDVLEISCIDPGTIRLPRRPTPQVEYLTNAEVQALRNCIDSNHLMGLRLRTIFETLLATGMRISEALSLKRDSIRRDLGQAVITGKGGRQRTVFFSDECLGWIDRYVGARHDISNSLFVTSGPNPRPLKRGDIPRYFKPVARAAGIQKHFTPHLLRHTFCTNLRNNGADISLIKELAGHRDIETTARYYLGSDTQVLQNAVAKYLNYSDSAAIGTGLAALG